MAVMALFMLSLLVVVAAFAVELGMFMAHKTEMQRSADAAALAACWEYVAHLNQGVDEVDARDCARELAADIAGTNLVKLTSLEADLNDANDSEGDIVFGTYSSFGDPYGDMTPLAEGVANAVKVRLRQTTVRNGEVRFTLARLLGIDSKPLEVEAMASISSEIRGFYAPGEEWQTLNMLPFAVKREMWDDLIENGGQDQFTYDFETGTVTSGGDGVAELNIFPHATGVSGNSGTVDIGPSGNSTSDIKRQIVDGVSADDLSYHGGRLEFNSDGELFLNGDTGISAGMKDELSSIIGEPRVIMIYSEVSGNGNNATFTIVRFVGIRIVEVNFQGSKNTSKRLMVQPSNVVAEFAIVGDSGDNTSQMVFSPAVLVN
jgi:hypothetical protein